MKSLAETVAVVPRYLYEDIAWRRCFVIAFPLLLYVDNIGGPGEIEASFWCTIYAYLLLLPLFGV
jgi:hypothetical protein